MRAPMPFRRPTGRTSWFVVAILVVTLLAGCTDAPSGDPAPGLATDESAAHAELEGLRHFFGSVEARDFTVETLDGDELTLSDLRGKVVFVEFMGAGCSTCLRNLPHHFELYEAYGEREEFVFLALDVWTNENEDDLREYRNKHDIPWPMAMSPGQTARDYSAHSTPTQYFIDHEGLYHSRGGYVESASLMAETAYLLEQVGESASAGEEA